jgi:HD-GYP domain-containing protein (c-di-GMP phosphodiesterase class II)
MRNAMQQLTTSAIAEGQRLEQAMFLPNGQKLLNAGVLITRRHLQVLSNLSDPKIYLAESLGELEDAGVVQSMESNRLRVGDKAHRDVLSAGGNLLVVRGEHIEQHHIDALSDGAYSSASGHDDDGNVDVARLRRERMLMADASVEQMEAEAQNLALVVRPEPESIVLPDHRGAEPWPEIDELSAWRDKRVAQIRYCFGRIEAGLPQQAAMLQSIVDDLFAMLLKHPERFAQLALLCPRRSDYLPDHACCVTVLAMASAVQLRWNEAEVRRLGLAALLCDLGMLLVPQRIRTGGCELTEIDRNRVQRHPAFSVAMTECIDKVEPIVKLAAFQHHERDTGMGYPLGARREKICDYAKLIAICDVFAAASSPRAYHQPKLPYVVMEEIIRSAAAGIFDKGATRALVSAAGLFPVGSYVLLSDRKIAHVLSSNMQRIDRPCVRLLDANGEPTDTTLNLADVPPDKLSVVRPAPPPKPLQPA